MISLKKALCSSVTQKFLMALSGLGLVGFVVTHLLGNLTLLVPGGHAFNEYAHKLESLGPLLYVAEVGLIGIFFLHIVTAIGLKKGHSEARPVSYRVYKTKGGDSRYGWASANMIVTGIVLLVFVVLHVWQFKFGPGVKEGYLTQVAGGQARDLYRLVVEVFKNPGWVAIYISCMLLLSMHLRHGVWSAFQSLGLMHPRCAPLINFGGLILALALGIGFLLLPLYLFFFA